MIFRICPSGEDTLAITSMPQVHMLKDSPKQKHLLWGVSSGFALLYFLSKEPTKAQASLCCSLEFNYIKLSLVRQ